MIERKSRQPGQLTAPSTAADAANDTAPGFGRRSTFEALAALRRRHAAAVRLPGENPDPLHPGRRYHRPSTGLRAAGYREGYVAALRWLLREHPEHIHELLRSKITAIIERADG
jgi:hypothetical protein